MHAVDELKRTSLLATTVVGLGFGAYHQTPLTEPNDTNPPSSLILSNAPLRQLSDGVYGLGLVRLDKNRRVVTFPCTVNMSEGLVEYALVHRTGKVHESVLKTEVNASQIHLACLLLGLGPPPEFSADDRTPRELRGPRVTLRARWVLNDVEKRVPLEELVLNTLTQSAMRPGPWAYSSSRVVQGTFLAERDGSIVAIIADPDALINNPRPGRNDDEIWTVNHSRVPPVGTPVEVTMELYHPAATALAQPTTDSH
jgi:hypothetical protein